jgi:hypothetical protein
MRKSAYPAPIVVGTQQASNVAAWCNEVLSSTREQVTQRVRDDVRRRIHERECQAPPAVHHHPREGYRR